MVQGNLTGPVCSGVDAIDKLNTEDGSEIPTLLKIFLPVVHTEVMSEHHELRAKSSSHCVSALPE